MSWHSAEVSSRTSTSKMLWLGLGILALLLVCACAGGLCFLSGLPGAWAERGEKPATALPASPSTQQGADLADTGPASDITGPVSGGAVRVKVAPTEVPVSGPFQVTVSLSNPGQSFVDIWWVAFAGDVARLIMDAQGYPLEISYEGDQPAAGIRIPGGLTVEPGAERVLVFDAHAAVPGEYTGSIVLCTSPDPSPDTCAVAPFSIVVGE